MMRGWKSENMNLLIVDDEVIIVSLLKKHIVWEELGI